MQKHVNLVDLVKSFPTNILLQNLASIQKRTSPIKFAYLAEKSEKGSISNLSTKLDTSIRQGVVLIVPEFKTPDMGTLPRQLLNVIVGNIPPTENDQAPHFQIKSLDVEVQLLECGCG